MSRFNATISKQKPDTENKAGGQAFSMSSKLELITLVMTSFLKDKFYESANEQVARIQKLCSEIEDKKFIAKLAIYARTKGNMRSASHLLAGEVAKVVKGETYTKNFFNKIVVRVDDMTEIMSYYFSSMKVNKKGKFRSVPNSMKKGFAKAFNKFDAYQLAKYRGEGKGLKLIDLVNLVHPKPVDKNGMVKIERIQYCKAKVPTASNHIFSEDELPTDIISISSLEALTLGLLKNTDTWESKQSKTGQEIAKKAKELNLNEVEKEKLLNEEKADNWKELIESKKIGYFALLRNLRNIVTQAPEMIDKACELLTAENMILNSKVLPFRFMTALDEIEKISDSTNGDIWSAKRKILVAINKAMEVAIKNVPQFDGSTLVALDVSGSMDGQPSKIGSLFAGVIVKSNVNADMLVFDTSSKYLNINPLDSLTTIIKSLRFNGGGTDFNCIFTGLKKAYDRVIVLSDMQGWFGYNTPTKTFNEYKKKFSCNPYIYSFDLNGYGTSQFPDSQVRLFFGFSEQVLEVMKKSELDKNALLNEVESIEI